MEKDPETNLHIVQCFPMICEPCGEVIITFYAFEWVTSIYEENLKVILIEYERSVLKSYSCKLTFLLNIHYDIAHFSGFSQ